MVITGNTTHRLNLVRTYDATNPYQVGINGVTSVTTNSLGEDVIVYEINDIEYTTIIREKAENVSQVVGSTNSSTSLNLNSPINSTKSYIPNVGDRFQKDIPYPTTFRFVSQPINEDDYFIFKDEVKMGVVFTPKVEEEVFIERQRLTVFESQARLSEIYSLESLEGYNNGYYNVTKIE